MNNAKKEKSIESQSKVSKYFATLSLFIGYNTVTVPGYFGAHLTVFFWLNLIYIHIFVWYFIKVFISNISEKFLFNRSGGFRFSVF